MIEYTDEQLQRAYQNWQSAEANKRDDLWHTYLDIREKKPLGYHGQTAAENAKKESTYKYN